MNAQIPYCWTMRYTNGYSDLGHPVGPHPAGSHPGGPHPASPSDPDTVLFTPLGFNLAETTRMIEVARHLPPTLRAVFLAHDDRYLRLVREAGFPHLPGAPSFTRAEQDQAMAFDQGRTLRHPFTAEVLEQRVQAERAAIRDLAAVAVVHGTNPTSPISARAEDVPLFYPVPYVFSRPQLDSGAVVPVLPAGRGAVLNRPLTRITDWVFTRAPLLPPSFRQAAARHGAHSVTTLMDLLGADVTLLTAMADEVGTDPLPPSHHRVGPIFARLPGEVPPEVRQLAAAAEPVVYLAVGSSGTRGLVMDAIRALKDLPIRVIAPVRDYLQPGDLDAMPDNVMVTDLLPAHLLGPFVDAAVLHGGQGTVQTACATGVPFVGMGLSAEQRWNVEVSERRGNAIAIAPHQLRGEAARFRQALHQVLFDPVVREIAQDVQREYALEDGAARSAQVITELVRAQR